MYISDPPKLTRRLKPNQAFEELTPKMKVALRILEYSDVDNEAVYFSKLVKEMKRVVSRKTIHEALDSLVDQGAIHSKWKKNPEERWVRGYEPASEGQRRILRRTYYATHDES